MSRCFALFALAPLLGCAGAAPELTEMVVVVEAGPQLRAMADRVEVGYTRGYDPTVTTTVTTTATQAFPTPSWPVSLTLVASEPKASLALVITAYKGLEPLVTRTVTTQFLPERSLLLGLRLEDACIGDLLSCTTYGQTCDAVSGTATCISSALDARSLPDYEGQRYDAGPLAPVDAGVDASADAGGDAAVSADAGL
jgi:hypothetical protein